MSKLSQRGYNGLLGEIKQRIHSAQYEALRAVNKELILLYWDIGRIIVERQKGKTRGMSIVKMLASDLQQEFHGIKGFPPSNLWRMRIFFQMYNKNQKLAQLVREIGWGHNILIMEKCDSKLE